MISLIKTEPLQVERKSIAIANLPTFLQGKKIVQLSDFHYDGLRLSPDLLIEAITLANREEPDLILLTGDYVTDEPEPIRDLVKYLKKLRSKEGIYASLGNHDIYLPHSKQVVTHALESVGIHVLCNNIAYPWGQALPIAGLADFWSGDFQPQLILPTLHPRQPRLVLSHNPDTARILKRWRVDLQLSGHTHGGQIYIPGYGPAPILLQQIRKITPKPLQRLIPFLQECSNVVSNWQWAQGLHYIGQNKLYVNRGLGTYFPGRFFCPPELTVITLIPW
ncbi:MAG: metallophosphoesterase [Cyanobacteria bacterium J083]|nr:MAG: metallophosphoesterase [Cyanobacteria bacterium J083]